MNRRHQAILFLSIVVAMLGYGIAMPVLPFIIHDMGGRGTQLGLMIACYASMQLLLAPFWGAMSDRSGRRPMLLIGLLGLSTAMILLGFSTRIWMLYLAQLLSGTLSSAIFPVSMAYVSDTTEEEARGGAIGKIGAAVGLGMILGPGVGGLIASESLQLPFFVAAGLSLVTSVIIFFSLPESLPVEKRSKERGSLSLLPFKKLYKALFTPMAFGLIMATAVNFGKSNFSSIYGLYALEVFGYGPQEVGSFLMAMSFMYIIAQGVVIGPLTKKFGEERIITVASMGNATGFLLLLLAKSYVTILLAMCFFILFNALLKPSAISFISKNTLMNQGSAMGITDSYMGLGRLMGPLWAGMMFDGHVTYPFITGAILFFILFLVSVGRWFLFSEAEPANQR